MGYNADEADVEQQAAEKAYAEKRAHVQAAVDKAVAERAEAERAELWKLGQKIDRAVQLAKLNREIRISLKDRRWQYF